MHSVSQFLIRMGTPVTKWDSEVFSSTGYMVAVYVALANWDSRYLNLLQNSVNIPSSADIYTALAAMPPPIILDPM